MMILIKTSNDFSNALFLAGVALLGNVLNEMGWYANQTGRGTVDDIATLISPSSSSSPSLLLLSLLAITSIGAPLLEEIVFRGFIFPSLTKFMNEDSAIILTSVAFAASHLSGRKRTI